MHSSSRLTLVIVVLLSSLARPVNAGQVAARPMVGKVRALAVPYSETKTIARLHRDGWIEARGELLSVAAFPELYETIGRMWTADWVKGNCFAVPQISDRSQRRASLNNLDGVMGSSDLVAGGRMMKAWFRDSSLSYWIYVGRAVISTGVAPVQ